MNRFENGFDSYQKAIVELEHRSENEAKLKAVVINFHHAIEVLFKHILYSKSKCLIYRNVDSWVDMAFSRKIGSKIQQKENVDYTISFDETVKRVMIVCEEQIDSYAYNGFVNLNELRNALTHDETELKIASVEQIVVTLTPIVTAILQKHLTGEEKEQFDSFVTSEQYQDILQNLIRNNVVWRITTISNLLKLYSHRDYEDLLKTEIRHLGWTLSLLGVTVEKEEKFYIINNNNVYTTPISYLKQEICDLLVRQLEIIDEKNEEIKEEIEDVIKRTDVIKDIVQEYLVKAALCVYNRFHDSRCVSFEEEETVHEILDHNSFVDNNDIYALLYCMGKIVEILVMITGEKNREKLLKEIPLEGSKEETISLMYSTLLSWFLKNKWFNRINMENLNKNIRDEVKSDRVWEEVEEKIWYDELYQELIGGLGEWGTIDRIDYVSAEELQTVVTSEREIILVYNVSFSVQTYFDHEFYDSGEASCYIKVVGHMEDDCLKVDNAEYMGIEGGFRSFGFD